MDVEGVGRPFPRRPAEPLELDLGEMEAVHRHQRRYRPQLVDDLGDEQAGKGRFTGAGRPGDAEHRSPARTAERLCPRHQRGQVPGGAGVFGPARPAVLLRSFIGDAATLMHAL